MFGAGQLFPTGPAAYRQLHHFPWSGQVIEGICTWVVPPNPHAAGTGWRRCLWSNQKGDKIKSARQHDLIRALDIRN